MTTPYYEHGGITIYHGDALDVLPSLAGADLMVTDPPYVFGLSSTTAGGKCGGWGDLMNSARWYQSWLKESKRLTANRSGAAWIFNSWRSFPVLARACHEVWAIDSLLVWDKMHFGQGTQLRSSYEFVALCSHPGFKLRNRGLPDIWRHKRESLNSGHSAEKPVGLLQRIIAESGDSGLVLDPFMGSGSTLLAAKNLGRSAVGIEIEERWCEVAAKGLAQEVLSFACSEPVSATAARAIEPTKGTS